MAGRSTADPRELNRSNCRLLLLFPFDFARDNEEVLFICSANLFCWLLHWGPNRRFAVDWAVGISRP